jgi:Fe-S-cluster containining protein
MHNGDGVCFNLDRETNLCSIYETRPLICNIERGWREIFWSDMTIEEWIEMNEEACKKLRGV